MIKSLKARLLPQQAASEQSLAVYFAGELAVDPSRVKAVRVSKRSIDARRRTVYVGIEAEVFVDETPSRPVCEPVEYGDVSAAPPVVVVGAGPAGLFAALRLVELGLRPVVVERGKDVRERKADLAMIPRSQQVDPESNYSFGEGGAGAYSDGKLYTRSKKRGDTRRVLETLCRHGAPEGILSDARPHIGTDKLPAVIEAIRNTIISSGGEVRFGTKMTSLLTGPGGAVEGIRAVVPETGAEMELRGPVILATGHSARDVYSYLDAAGVAMEAKGIAVGVRVEHPSALIDRIQYHSREGRGEYLPAAEYVFKAQVDGRGVYSFCMCPGGVVVPAASGPGQIVVNGMSPSHRGTKWSNSGMVVETRPEDVPGGGVLKMMAWQEEMERLCWQQGNMRQTAPAQRMADFVAGRVGSTLPATSYQPGLIPSPLHFWLPQGIAGRLRSAFAAFGKSARGFLTNEAAVIAVETRTSAPVRVLRDPSTLQHVGRPGLFPCGEGAGYAGGIVSAAMDGGKCAEAAAAYCSAM